MKIDFSDYYVPKPKQALAHACRAKYLLFGGSLGGGKTYFLCGEAIKQAMKYPGNRLTIIRKELSVLRRTTLVTFFKVCPAQIIQTYNQSRLEITFVNGSVLIFLDADIAKDSLLQKIKGLELGWWGIDEASEVSKSVYDILKTRLRWVLPDGRIPKYEGRLTSNPENCWLIPTFIQSVNPEEFYIQSLTTDNYSEDSDYVQNLKDAFRDSPNLLRKYLFADWSISDAINQLIPSEAITNAANHVQGYYGTALGIDVSRYGDDNTVFVLLKDRNVELIEVYPQTSIMEIITRTIQLITDYQINPNYVAIDAVGLGAGCVDGLRQQGYNVTEIIGGASPEETSTNEAFRPFNLRAQIYFELRKSLISGELGNVKDEALKVELSAIKYEICGDRTMRIVSKEAIKKILGHSPDLADALAYANFVLKRKQSNFVWVLPYFGN